MPRFRHVAHAMKSPLREASRRFSAFAALPACPAISFRRDAHQREKTFGGEPLAGFAPPPVSFFAAARARQPPPAFALPAHAAEYSSSSQNTPPGAWQSLSASSFRGGARFTIARQLQL